MTAAVILAAGGSARLGEPKQLLLHDGKTLIQWAVEAALVSGCKPVVAVLGAHAELISSYLPHPDVDVVINPNWEEGIGSSISVAAKHLLADENITQAVFLLCDQPFADANLLKKLISTKAATNDSIVASAYGDTFGVPAIFDRAMFNQLSLLRGDEGAKRLMMAHADVLSTIRFEQGIIDIDTRDDADRFLGGPAEQ